MAEKIETWEGVTRSHRFSVDFYSDDEQGLFRATLEATSPPMGQMIRAGQPVPTLKEEEPIRLKEHTDFEVLKGIARETIRARYGEIVRLQVRSTKQGN